MRHVIVASAVALTVLGTGCGGEGEAPAADTPGPGAPPPSAMPSEAITPEIQTALERGNEAYRADDYERALELYEEALALDSTVNASWFGVYMAHEALGNEEEADAIRERLGAGPVMPHPGAGGSSPHPGTGGSPHPGAGAMPPAGAGADDGPGGAGGGAP